MSNSPFPKIDVSCLATGCRSLIVCAAGLVALWLDAGEAAASFSLQLEKPAHREEVFPPFPQFGWSAHPEAFEDVGSPVFYEIEIARDIEFAAVVDRDTVYLNRYVHDRPLTPGEYYWRVRAGSGGGETGPWTQPGKFSIVPCDEEVRVDYETGADDHGGAVRAAVTEAVSLAADGRSVRLVFPTGDYRFAGAPRSALIELENTGNLVIDGNGSRVLLLERDTGLMTANNTRNITLMGFSIDFPEEKTFVQGRVEAVSVERNRVRVAVEPGFPDYAEAEIKETELFISLLDPEIDGRLKTKASNYFYPENIVPGPDGTWEFNLRAPKDAVREWAVGDRFVHFLRRGGRALVGIYDSRHTTLYDLTSTGTSQFHYHALEGSYLTVLHCRTELAEGNWISGNGDGVHCRGYEVGPWVEGCSFRGLADDGVALYARPATIARPHPDGDVFAAICNDQFFNLEAGDSVSFFRPEDGSILLETTVTDVAPATGEGFRVAFADPVPAQLLSGGSIVEKEAEEAHPRRNPELADRVQDLPQIWNRSKSSGDFVIRGNTFQDVRRYGIAFRARRGVVEKNRFKGISSGAFVSKNEPQWPNGLYSSDIIVRSNVVRESGFDGNGQGPQIVFATLARNEQPASSVGSRNILIEDNVFTANPSPEAQLISAGQILLRNNRVVSRDGRVREPIAISSP